MLLQVGYSCCAACDEPFIEPVAHVMPDTQAICLACADYLDNIAEGEYSGGCAVVHLDYDADSLAGG